MSSSFPLFEIMLSEIDSDQIIQDSEKTELCEKIKKMDNEGYELIYALMKSYAIRFDQNFESPPFHPKKIQKGYKFDIDLLPNKLILILSHFVKKHNQKLMEETIRLL